MIAKDQHKKGTVLGGYIEAYLIIRSPLLGPEVVVTEERSLVLEAWPEISSSSSSHSSSSSSPSSLSSPIVAAAAITAATAIGPKSSSSSSSSLTTSVQLTKEEMLDPHSVNNIESNEVLEHEISQAEDFIRSCSLTISSVSNNDDDDDKEGDLIAMRIRLQLLQSKLQVLVYKVQNDVLTMEQYLNLLRERIKRDQVLAIYLKQSSSSSSSLSSTAKVGDSGSSNVQDALRVLKRVKIMQKEVSDVEENMKSDDP
jgi:predicted Mrr-cat superfamily restriction endonuclease